MTTPQPAALPDLTAVIAWLENGCDPYEAVKELKHYQSKLRALAALQSQPAAAGVSDAEILSAHGRLFKSFLIGKERDNAIKFARAILALRPQAVPMTEDTARLDWLGANPACKIFNEDGEWSFDGKLCLDLRDAIDNARGITAQGAQGGEGK